MKWFRAVVGVLMFIVQLIDAVLMVRRMALVI